MPDKKDDHFHGVLDDVGLQTRQVRKYSVEDALNVLPKKKNGEMAWDRPAGREIW